MGSPIQSLMPAKVMVIWVILCVFTPFAHGARKYESIEKLKLANAEMGLRKRDGSSQYFQDQLHLEEQAGVEAVDELVSAQGNKKKKYRETYNGYKVYNTGIDVEENASGDDVIVSFDIYGDLEDDLSGDFDCELSNEEAKAMTLSHFDMESATVDYSEFYDWIYVDDNNVARFAVDVELFVITANDELARPHAFIDKCDKTILEAYDRGGFFTVPPIDDYTDAPAPATPAPATPAPATPAPAPAPNTPAPNPNPNPSPNPSPNPNPNPSCDIVDKAGNPKRTINFGPNSKHCLAPLRRSADGTKCFLENQYIKGVDLKNQDDASQTEIASFVCKDGYDDANNGGFSPMLDVFYYGTKSATMYRDWYNYAPLTDPVPYGKAHFKKNYVNAYWDGRSLVFGDGDGSTYYPLTNLDTVAHELGHGVIERSSNLAYREQSGGMNEAFADMVGEVTEEYLFGSTDWLSGADFYFAQGKALRYFENPPDDGVSIKHVNEYRSGMDVHYSSGVYNHVFWRISQKIGVRNAFECFLIANRLYWRENTNFEEGACGTMRGAYDAGFDLEVVEAAFKAVGITFSKCSNTADFITAELKAGAQQTGLKVSHKRNPIFKINVPSGSSSVTVTGSGGVLVSISDSFKRSSTPKAQGSGSVTTVVTGGSLVYVRFYRGLTDAEVTDVSATVTFG